jgi:hypothetical protein
MKNKGMYLFKEANYFDRERECWLRLSGDYRFGQDIPYVFVHLRSGRFSYRKAGILDVIKSWFIN